MQPKLRDLKITTTVFVHNSLGQDFEQSFSRQCFCSRQYWLRSVSQLHSCYLGWEIDPKSLCSPVWHHCALLCGLFFFMWLKWASSWSSQCMQTFYVASHFQERSLQAVKEDTADLRLSHRSYTQSLLLHCISQNSS